MTRTRLLVALPLLALASPARADPPALADAPRPAAFEALVRCRAIAEDAARLRCFDAAAAALDQAAQRRDVVVVDREQVRESRRRLFGLSLPRLPVFGSGDHQDEEVTSIDSTVRAASQEGYGAWVISLADGSTWVQTDGHSLAFFPRPGQPVHVSRGALGSFILRVNNQPGIRVQRRN